MAEDDDRDSKRPPRRPSLFPSLAGDDLAPLPSHRPSLFPGAPEEDAELLVPAYRPSLFPGATEDASPTLRASIRPSLFPGAPEGNESPAPSHRPSLMPGAPGTALAVESEPESARPSRRPSMLPAGDAEITIGNLRLGIPHVLPDELFTTLAAGTNVRVERIVSRGHRSDEGFWFDQDEHEFVMVVSGHARVEVEQQGELDLRAGDYLVLPAHVKHRVTWTEPQQDTVWLAVYYQVA
jgi:cupin 2 domain-containing protein